MTKKICLKHINRHQLTNTHTTNKDTDTDKETNTPDKITNTHKH